MKYMYSNAPASKILKLPEPFRTAVQNSRQWKWERNQGLETRCLFHRLVWARRWIPTEWYLRTTTCNLLLNFEIDASTSDVNGIPGRYLKVFIFRCVLYERLPIVGFLVDNQKIYTFEVYRPAFGDRREPMTWNILFFSSSKSFITCLNGHINEL